MLARYRTLSLLSVLGPSVLFSQTAIKRSAPTLNVQVQHVIEVADLQATPPGGTEGQATTFRFKVKNTGSTAAVAIPWALEVDGRVISSGNAPGLKSGESWESTKGWTATSGTHAVRFLVDPSGTGGASGAPAALRSRQLSYAVTALPATEVRLIDWDMAKQVGMTYGAGLQMPTACRSWLSPVANANYTNNVGSNYSQRVGWVHVGISCPYTGGRMNATVFDNLQLRNNWRVKSVFVDRTYQGGTSDWQYTNTPPAPGSDRPRVNLGLWANGFAEIHLALKVEIEGPRGTDPYR